MLNRIRRSKTLKGEITLTWAKIQFSSLWNSEEFPFTAGWRCPKSIQTGDSIKHFPFAFRFGALHFSSSISPVSGALPKMPMPFSIRQSHFQFFAFFPIWPSSQFDAMCSLFCNQIVFITSAQLNCKHLQATLLPVPASKKSHPLNLEK